MQSHKRFYRFTVTEYAIPHYAGLFQFTTVEDDCNWKYVFHIADVIPNSKLWTMVNSIECAAISAPSFTPVKELVISSHNEQSPLWTRAYRMISDMNVGVLCFANSGIHDRPRYDFLVSEEEDSMFTVPVIRTCDKIAWIVELNTKF